MARKPWHRARTPRSLRSAKMQWRSLKISSSRAAVSVARRSALTTARHPAVSAKPHAAVLGIPITPPPLTRSVTNSQDDQVHRRVACLIGLQHVRERDVAANNPPARHTHRHQLVRLVPAQPDGAHRSHTLLGTQKGAAASGCCNSLLVSHATHTRQDSLALHGGTHWMCWYMWSHDGVSPSSVASKLRPRQHVQHLNTPGFPWIL